MPFTRYLADTIYAMQRFDRIYALMFDDGCMLAAERTCVQIDTTQHVC